MFEIAFLFDQLPSRLAVIVNKAKRVILVNVIKK